ncbi:enoyl-CoA hydratase/isomerase family protein [Elioraea rosea]|uniref:enoyl-CoA hydratase/isomerase family protein n=1 Tax=Elioraea rosea TaxID=2492390 RepID=UPI0011822C01|nr:enoyl-CoA hydratase/isomerase family protein [Elioraea rosea]
MTDAPAEPTVLSEVTQGVGRLVLNRPRALNALDRGMIDAVSAALTAWRDDPAVALVTIEGAGGRAFCAGGDVRAVRTLALAGETEAIEEFFVAEYAVNRMIAEYPKPYVALIDGISMGGGLGLSIHGSHRVVTEHAVMAMPETAIALFPDIGATYFLPRLPGQTGMYLALTGARVSPGDAIHTGLATHYVPRGALESLKAGLGREGIDAVARHAAPPPESLFAAEREAIDRCFAGPSVAAILAALEAEGSDWAKATHATLLQMSPTSLWVSFEAIRRGASMTLAECLAMELALTRGVTRHPDFAEGVRAQVIDKTRDPRWTPASVEAVDPADIAALFAGRWPR